RSAVAPSPVRRRAFRGREAGLQQWKRMTPFPVEHLDADVEAGGITRAESFTQSGECLTQGRNVSGVQGLINEVRHLIDDRVRCLERRFLHWTPRARVLGIGFIPDATKDHGRESCFSQAMPPSLVADWMGRIDSDSGGSEA